MITNEWAHKKKHEDKKLKIDWSNILYRNAIGALNYLTNCNRLDITFAVHKLSCRLSDYTIDDDWVEVQHVLRFIWDHKSDELIITFKSKGMECFVDASLAILRVRWFVIY